MGGAKSLGAGVYAIIFGGLISLAVKTMGVGVWHFWHSSWHWKKGDLVEFARFGGFQIGDRVANYVWNTADYMLIGRLLGADALAPIGSHSK